MDISVEKKIPKSFRFKQICLDLDQIYNINKDNKALYNKLLEISSREKVNTILNKTKSSHSQGRSGLKNNLGSIKPTNMGFDNPIMRDAYNQNIITNQYEDEEGDLQEDNYMENQERVGDTVLPNIFLNQNKGFVE